MSNIYQLAEQAAEHAVLNPEDESLRSETEDAVVEVPKAFIDKFAELLIAECVRIAKSTPCPYTDEETRKLHGHTWDMACIEAGNHVKEQIGDK